MSGLVINIEPLRTVFFSGIPYEPDDTRLHKDIMEGKVYVFQYTHPQYHETIDIFCYNPDLVLNDCIGSCGVDFEKMTEYSIRNATMKDLEGL
jgi:hypothetical protein